MDPTTMDATTRELGERLGLIERVDDRSDAERQRDEEAERELAGRGAPHGLSAAEVAAADRLNMSLEKYAGYRGVRSIDDVAALRQREAAMARARDEAEHARLVELAKAGA